MNDTINAQLRKLRKILEILGFSDDQIQTHLQKLSELIFLAIISRIGEKNRDNPPKNLDPKSLDDYLKEHYKPEELLTILSQETQKILRSYLSPMLQKADNAKIIEIEALLNEN